MFSLTALLAVAAGCIREPGLPPGPTDAPSSGRNAPIQWAGKNKVIIFVHGVMGSERTTWRNSRTGAMWPDLIRNDPELAASFAVHVLEYDSPARAQSSTVEQIAQRELQRLRDHGAFEGDRELYFITHSMGGLVVKRMVVELNRPLDAANLRRVRAVVYLSTPSQGSKLAEVASWLSLNPQFRDLGPKEFNTFLQTLENQWRQLLRDRDAEHYLLPRSYCAYETKPTHGFHVVPELYAETSCDHTAYPIDVNHLDIASPPDLGVDPHPWTKARLLEASRLRPRRSASGSCRFDREGVLCVAAQPQTERDRMLLAAATTLQAEFLRVTRAKSSGFAESDFRDVRTLVDFLSGVDPGNGHGLYYAGELKRYLNMETRTGLGYLRSHEDFHRYLTIERTVGDAEKDPTTTADACYTRPRGYCAERTAWINHLLATDFHRSAGVVVESDIKELYLCKARQYSVAALRFGGFIDPGQHTPTPALLTRIERELGAEGIARCQPRVAPIPAS